MGLDLFGLITGKGKKEVFKKVMLEVKKRIFVIKHRGIWSSSLGNYDVFSLGFFYSCYN